MKPLTCCTPKQNAGPSATDDARNVQSPMRVTLGVQKNSVKPFWQQETARKRIATNVSPGDRAKKRIRLCNRLSRRGQGRRSRQLKAIERSPFENAPRMNHAQKSDFRKNLENYHLAC